MNTELLMPDLIALNMVLDAALKVGTDNINMSNTEEDLIWLCHKELGIQILEGGLLWGYQGLEDFEALAKRFGIAERQAVHLFASLDDDDEFRSAQVAVKNLIRFIAEAGKMRYRYVACFQSDETDKGWVVNNYIPTDFLSVGTLLGFDSVKSEDPGFLFRVIDDHTVRHSKAGDISFMSILYDGSAFVTSDEFDLACQKEGWERYPD